MPARQAASNANAPGPKTNEVSGPSTETVLGSYRHVAYEREDLLAASAGLEKRLHDKLAHLAEHPTVAEVRSGTGAVAAVQLVDPAAAFGLAKALRAHGVATRAVGAGGIQISPAFIITDDQVDELVAGFAAALG